MAHSIQTQRDVYGPGTYTDSEFIPVPQDAERLLKHFMRITPGFVNDLKEAQKVSFHGAALPIIPGPLKSQVLSSVCNAMIGIVSSEICKLKGVETGPISINTDHAGLFPAAVGLVTIGEKDFVTINKENIPSKVGADLDHHFLTKTPMLNRTWLIYPTKDPHVWYQPLGSLSPAAWLKAFDLDENAAKTLDEAYEITKAEMVKHSARELECISMEHGFCGSICRSPQAWRDSRMGKDLARHPMIDYQHVPAYFNLAPVPFPKAVDHRPLAGIKVVELSRVIAAPALGSMLAALGAEVIRVEPPNLHDMQPLNLTLTAGKRTCGLDLNKESDRKHLEGLVAEADVFIQAFRLGSLRRRGFGLHDVLEMANQRGKGIVYVDLNCYGPDGYYAERPGFQQLADAATGCSYVCGKAYGLEEGTAVLPSLPISDMLSGAVGVIDVLLALRDRATKGGSYHAHVALASVDTAQLSPEMGLYPPEIVQKIQDNHRFPKMTPDLMVEELLVLVADAWAKTTDLLKQDDFFVTFKETPFGKDHRILAPVTKFENRDVNFVYPWGPVPYCWEEYPVFN